jgi:endonuclease/exonuclease/phosphatase family metal-dependent hydrolase
MLKQLGAVAAIVALLGAGVSDAIAQNKNRNLVVMTRNMDTGSDFKFVINAKTLSELVLGVTLTYQEILASNIPERADGIAAEIQKQQPDLVALQEITTLMNGPLGGPATNIVTDQLRSLRAALARRGVHYAPVAIQRNADFEFPALDPASNTLFDARLTDFDVVLARTDLPVSELKIGQVTKQHFTAALVFTILGQVISVPRGWIAVDAKLRGKPYRVVDTHLESVDLAIQVAQALELVNGPILADVPVVFAGDINSDADSSDPLLSASYHTLVNAGLLDFWPIIHPGDPGFTNPLHGEDPFTPFSIPNQRIDVILAKPGGKGIEARDELLIGNTTSALTPHGLWPSDHAGVVESFTLLP